jgi:chromosome segregation protein
MRLKSLEIHGFKTFTEPLTLTFPGALTSIVGPNGSGKSNVVDAVRWVLAENNPRKLRATSPSDLIFHGSAGSKAMGLAEVSITLDDLTGRLSGPYAGLEEVTITRRLYTDGQSENFINRAACRLKDIRELLLDTGLGTHAYSIIAQGQIAFLVESQAQERRILIEEAAGILKYRERKIEALRKLDQAQGNLVRVEDLIAELEKQTKTLRRQAKRAEGYKELMTRLRSADLAWRSLRLARLAESRAAREADCAAAAEKRRALAARTAALEGDLETLRLARVERDKRLAALREALAEARRGVERLEAERKHQTELAAEGERKLGFLSSETAAAAERAEGMRSRLEDARRREGEIEKRLEGLTRACAEIEISLKEAQAAEVAAEAVFAERNRAIFDLQNRAVELNNRTAFIELHQRQTTQKKAQLASDRAAAGTRLSEVSCRLEANVTSREGIGAEVADLAAQIDAGRADAERLGAELASEESSIREMEQQHARLLSRRETLAEALERDRDPGEAARALMGDPETRIRGQLLDLVEVEEGFETAVGVALGETVRGLAVEDFDHCLTLLETRVNGRGRVILCPVDGWSSPSEEGPAPEGTLGWAGGYVRPGPYREFFRRLLAGTAVAAGVREAQGLFVGNPSLTRIVTPAGAVVQRSGLVEGGAVSGAAVTVSLQADLTRVRKDGLRTEKELVKSKERRESLREASETARAQVAAQTAERESRERELLRLTEEERHLRQEVARVEGVIKGIEAEVAALVAEEADLAGQGRGVADAVAALEEERRAAEGAREEASARLEQARRRRTELHLEQTRRQADLGAAGEQKEAAGEQAKGLASMLADLSGAADSVTREAMETKERIGTARGRAEVLVTEIVTASGVAEKAAGELAEAEGQQEVTPTLPLENEIRELKGEMAGADEEVASFRIAIAQGETEAGLLIEALYTDHATTPEELPPAEGDEEELHRQVTDLSRRKEQYGPVNEEALDEYTQVEERYTFLTGQRNDLTESIASLRKAITHINQISRERFMEVFTAVREKFSELIPILFKGGKGDMVLSADEDVLDAGIELFVLPPGKKVKHLGQLSGGEKALVALAYLLAIYLIQPTPFCLLDEVDAPLDDANTEHFLRLIDTLKTGSQFIFVTHNKLTMEASDVLYGVTMDRPGISRVMAVKLQGFSGGAEGPEVS